MDFSSFSLCRIVSKQLGGLRFVLENEDIPTSVKVYG